MKEFISSRQLSLIHGELIEAFKNDPAYSPVEMFVSGKKPALYTKWINELSAYPSVGPCEGKRYLYFHTELDKQKFLDSGEFIHISGNNNSRFPSEYYKFTYFIGNFLGYPPSAVEFFNAQRGKPRVMVYWEGIHFITSPDILEENLDWMERKYGISTHILVQDLPISVSKRGTDIFE